MPPTPTPTPERPKMERAVQLQDPTQETRRKTGGEGGGWGKYILGGLAAVGFGVVAALSMGGATDQLTQQQMQQRTQAYEAALKAGPLAVGVVAQADVKKELAKLGLDPQAQAQIEQQIQKGESRLVMVGLFDDAVDDGDVVRLDAGGLSVVVPIHNGPNFIAVPAPAQGPVTVTVTGEVDGGGGITVAAMGAAGYIPLKPLTAGESASFTAN